MNTDIYYKILKYQQKLELEPNNSIYQYKLKYYYQMVGGNCTSSEAELMNCITRKLRLSASCYDAHPVTINTYIQSIQTLDFNAKKIIYTVLSLNFENFSDIPNFLLCLYQLLIINDLYPKIDSRIITSRLDNITLEQFKIKHITNINRIKQFLKIPIPVTTQKSREDRLRDIARIRGNKSLITPWKEIAATSPQATRY